MPAAKKTTAKKTPDKPGKQPADRQQPKSSKPDTSFGVEFHVKGRNYVISSGDLTAVESRLYRQQMGESLPMTFGRGDLDLDVLATLMWLMDRRDHPGLSWEDVAGQLTYDDVEQMEVGGEDPSS